MEDIETYGDRCFIAGCIVPSFESFPDRSFGAVPEKRTDRDRKSTRLNSSHNNQSRMPSSA